MHRVSIHLIAKFLRGWPAQHYYATQKRVHSDWLCVVILDGFDTTNQLCGKPFGRKWQTFWVIGSLRRRAKHAHVVGHLPRGESMYYRQSAKGLLLFLFALALLFFATTPASAAASLPHAPKDVQCLIVAVQSQVVGSQQFNIVTQVTNTCLATFTITTRINTQQTD